MRINLLSRAKLVKLMLILGAHALKSFVYEAEGALWSWLTLVQFGLLGAVDGLKSIHSRSRSRLRLLLRIVSWVRPLPFILFGEVGIKLHFDPFFWDIALVVADFWARHLFLQRQLMSRSLWDCRWAGIPRLFILYRSWLLLEDFLHFTFLF